MPRPRFPTLASLLFLVLLLDATILLAAPLTPDDASARLRMAHQLARERNDQPLVSEIEKAQREIAAALKQGPSDVVEVRLRQIEVKVGLDPGGWSMAGQPLFLPTKEMAAQWKSLEGKLAEAMPSGDPIRVRSVTTEMLAVLGDQAGIPDARRPGAKPPPRTLDEPAAVRLFLDALDGEERSMRELKQGRPLPDQMLRMYASLLDATTTVRPSVAKHLPERTADRDPLTYGLAGILTKLQQPAGHFPFPDLRGKNIRFGAMIDRQIAAGRAEVRDGWMISVDPDGGSQFDTGVCGTALLRAGDLHGHDAWKQAGLRAADWALAQPCCPNWNYNAFSVSLLAHAFRVSRDPRYLDGALQKFRVGVAPGQARNGRWLDPHNARTVYHLILLRGLADLATVLPAGRIAERAEVDQICRPAVKALLDEFDAMGQTVEALPELQSLAALYPDDVRLRHAVPAMASAIIAKCTDGTRVKMGAPPDQLAALANPQR